MSENIIFEQDIDHQLRLPWPTICKLAIKARCASLSLNDVMERALAEYALKQPSRRTDLTERIDMTTTTREALKQVLDAARSWIALTPHGDNCFLHSDGGEFDKCFCSKDGLLDNIESILAAANAAEATPAPEPVALQTWPKHIWLQGGETEVEEYTGSTEDMTWCEDNINRGDVQYVRADIAAPAPVDAQIDRDALAKMASALRLAGYSTCENSISGGGKLTLGFERLEDAHNAQGTLRALKFTENAVQQSGSLINEGDMQTAPNLKDRLDRAERALLRAGFEDLGGEEWKPPLGKQPIFIKVAQPVQAEPSAAVPAGWKLVPIEPDLFMKQAALENSRANGSYLGNSCNELHIVEQVYRAMLATTPAQQVQPAAQPASGAVDEQEEFDKLFGKAINKADISAADMPAAVATKLRGALWQEMFALSAVNHVNAAQPEKDAEFLDWLEKNQAGLYPVVNVVRRPTTMNSPAYEEVREFVGWSVNTRMDEFKTVREAIRAAIAAQTASNPTDRT